MMPDMSTGTPTATPVPLPADQLRWRCDPARLGFETTAQVEPVHGVVGQDTAVEALRFGLATDAPGHHVFVRGLSGTGRVTLVRQLMEQIRPMCPEARDRCYVHNFAQPTSPRLITLPRGQAPRFARLMDELCEFIRSELAGALRSEVHQSRRAAVRAQAERWIRTLVGPFEQELRAAGLALVTVDLGRVVQTAIFPLFEGKPVAPDAFEKLRAEGRVSDEQYAAVQQRIASFAQRFEQVTEAVRRERERFEAELRELDRQEIQALLGARVEPIAREFQHEALARYLAEVVQDVANHRLPLLARGVDFTRLYRVNVLVTHEPGVSCPIVVEANPTAANLLGTIEQQVTPRAGVRMDHLGIRAGALLRADGGYLLLEARDVLTLPGAWHALMRTLRTGRLEIGPPETIAPWLPRALKPEPVQVHTKVILIGDEELYALLDALDPDFPHLFKVLADFDTTIARNEAGMQLYAGVLARIAREEGHPPFDRTAVGALIEHGARVAARGGRLTARFSRVGDIAREAAFIARRRGHTTVAAGHVRDALAAARHRANLPSRRFQQRLAEGVIRVQTTGEAVGQVNGLAVIRAGPLVYGFPQRITATIGPGEVGVINIEREAELSGAIHTKSFYILGGLLRTLLGPEHPLAFDASIAFEQSYGGIDGDSASGAEICCLLSALTGLPLRQDLAMTGAIDQTGAIMAVGAVNEKIEGFFDACRVLGLSGTQGCVIPRANAPDLMLRDDVVEASAAGLFHVYAVDSVHDALTILTGRPAGVRDPHGRYPDGTVLAEAQQRARQFWIASRQRADGSVNS